MIGPRNVEYLLCVCVYPPNFIFVQLVLYLIVLESLAHLSVVQDMLVRQGNAWSKTFFILLPGRWR